ncbi:hypothetical protein [Bradyrhizobium sp.]|uniref:hypothetical protein n=1 Tax=Bradyrhizobium sp. TaxID=376 RepID=UPI003BB166F8
MKPLSVSTDVFARIWSLRQVGEDTEDAILRRVLWSLPEHTPFLKPEDRADRGLFDARHNVVFSEGFEIYRTYLGADYRAKAVGGRWVLADGREGGSLNELSRTIGAKTENAWQNWFFTDQAGQRLPVSEMRDPTTIAARKRHAQDSISGPKSTVITDQDSNNDETTWRDDLRTALEQLGGQAPLHRIYDQVELIRKKAGRSVPRTIEAVVRRTLEDHSSDSANFRAADLFFMPEGKGAGMWALRK